MKITLLKFFISLLLMISAIYWLEADVWITIALSIIIFLWACYKIVNFTNFGIIFKYKNNNFLKLNCDDEMANISQNNYLAEMELIKITKNIEMWVIKNNYDCKNILKVFDKLRIPAFFIDDLQNIELTNNSFKELLGEMVGKNLDFLFEIGTQYLAGYNILNIKKYLYQLDKHPINGQKICILNKISPVNALYYLAHTNKYPAAVISVHKDIICANDSFAKKFDNPVNTDCIFNQNDWLRTLEVLDSSEFCEEILFSPTSQLLCYDLYKLFNYEEFKTFLLIIFKDEKQRQISLDNQLAHSQKLQAVGQLAGGVAHDFNNLLTAMIGFCDLLLVKHPPGDISFPEIMQIKQNANRAANLVKQLLAFSRKQTLDLKVLDVSIIIDELANMISRLLGENIELNIYHGDNLWFTKADAGQLEQVFVNLVVNARDAMNRNGVLTIRTDNFTLNRLSDLPSNYMPPTEEDQILVGDYVRIIFEDTGCGIPSHKIPKIFEPFFSTKEVGAGVGLGLATVYGIIKQSGGYLYVDSLVNVGTKFCIFLPKSNEDKPVDIIAKESEPQDLTGSETILIVEDEEAVRLFGTQALIQKGYKVYEASNGDEAIEIIKKHGEDIDLIITDVMMPGINGPEMIQEISGDFPSIKVLFTSGYGEDIFIQEFGANRNFNFLAKPYNLKTLIEKVKDII
jgi:signal transduction histidine kinase/CheY-like chemotaxis protein